MRLDKLLSLTGTATRKEAARAARAGRIEVNGRAERDVSAKVDPASDRVFFDGIEVIYREHTYIMLNKPEGYISATEDGRGPVVLELLPEPLRRGGLFPCGRLDKNTTGLLLLTNDGALSHRLLDPRRHVDKKYRFKCRAPVSLSEREELESGLCLADGYLTRPAELELDRGSTSGIITLREGKYHQIKRMFGAAGDNRIIELERISFGPLTLDTSLERGEWRYLLEEEIAALISLDKKQSRPGKQRGIGT